MSQIHSVIANLVFLCSLSVSSLVSADVLLPAEALIPAAPEEYREELSKLQAEDSVCNIKLDYTHSQVFSGNEAVERMSPSMLAVVHRMHRELEYDRSLRHHTGALIELDVADENMPLIIRTEFGGVGIFADSKIEILSIPYEGRHELRAYTSRLGLSVSVFAHYNNNYSLPGWARSSIDHVFEFHLHATDADDSSECSPSFGTGNTSNGYSGDIGYAIDRIDKQGHFHGFVFTKLVGRTYSLVYFGGEKTPDGEWMVGVAALPNIAY
jgi:hypothetical protein